MLEFLEINHPGNPSERDLADKIYRVQVGLTIAFQKGPEYLTLKQFSLDLSKYPEPMGCGLIHIRSPVP